MSRGSSRMPGFYKLSRAQRVELLRAAVGGEDPPDFDSVAAADDFELFDGFIENAIGGFGLPLGVAVNFLVDGRDVLVPMAVEESSVIAAASNMARAVRGSGGFQTESIEDLMIGQVQITDLEDAEEAARRVRARAETLVVLANSTDSGLGAFGGGCRGIEVRPFTAEETGDSPALVVHLLVDCVDAMGANAVNTMCEAVAPQVAEWTGGRVGLRILSNLAAHRRFLARCRVDPDALAQPGEDGVEIARGIAAAARFAQYDPYRAATHNKGIMNGVDPVVIATGNDWRAVEAGAHAWAARDGQYRALSRWWLDESGLLAGELELPLQLGTVGGVTRLHPGARFALQLLGVQSASELARIAVAVGLAQNLAALRALATEGIQKGHMRLHARNLELAEREES